MNKLKIALSLLTLWTAATACDKEIEKFDNNENFIYFRIPYVLDQYGRPTTQLVDSITYSFALDPISVTKYTFAIPVYTIGLSASTDRTFRISVDSCSLAEGEWDRTVLTNAQIKAGNSIDTLHVTVNRSTMLKNTWASIVLRIEANENFSLGYRELQRVKLSVSDILMVPTWWSKWQKYFGEFSREKYVKWQEIYAEGADPNTETIGGPGMNKPLYWDNMPYYANESWYPSTFMFLRTLKQYFIDNVVYPDGDTSKPRITLP